jgi:hypothetical protein
MLNVISFFIGFSFLLATLFHPEVRGCVSR